MPALSKSRTIMPLALLAAVAMTCLQGAAFAGTMPVEGEFRTAKVSTTGLNLANPSHVAVLDERIGRAARSVCSPDNGRDLYSVSQRASCINAAMAGATAKRDVLVARAQSEQMAARADAPVGTAD